MCGRRVLMEPNIGCWFGLTASGRIREQLRVPSLCEADSRLVCSVTTALLRSEKSRLTVCYQMALVFVLRVFCFFLWPKFGTDAVTICVTLADSNTKKTLSAFCPVTFSYDLIKPEMFISTPKARRLICQAGDSSFFFSSAWIYTLIFTHTRQVDDSRTALVDIIWWLPDG